MSSWFVELDKYVLYTVVSLFFQAVWCCCYSYNNVFIRGVNSWFIFKWKLPMIFLYLWHMCVCALAIFVIIPDNGVYVCVWYMHTHHSALVRWKLNCKNYYWNKTAYKKSHSECKCILWKWFERHPMSKKPTTASITIYNAMATKKNELAKRTRYTLFLFQLHERSTK